jgi:hypothetical protein
MLTNLVQICTNWIQIRRLFAEGVLVLTNLASMPIQYSKQHTANGEMRREIQNPQMSILFFPSNHLLIARRLRLVLITGKSFTGNYR